MLTKELAVFGFDGGRIKPDRLMSKDHGHYVAYAKNMLDTYRNGIGKTRQELHLAVRQIFDQEPDCLPQRIDAFCKLLDEERCSKYETDHHGKAAALRCKVFRLAARFHPLVGQKIRLFDHGESDVKQTIAHELGRPDWAGIESALFADVFEYNRLISFIGYTNPEALLRRYNVGQVQVALFYATRLVIRARADLKQIVTYAKLARLLHEIAPSADNATSGEYVITLTGPASVLRETRRYGVDMAKFLPALLSCRDWNMKAEIRLNRAGRPLRLELSSDSGLKSEVPPREEFDSKVEEGFAKKWGQGKRNGWSMKREGGILQRRQIAFVPDFAFQHDDDRKVFLEIVGFWTPEYLQAKIKKLKQFEGENILLAVAERLAEKWKDMPREVILYKTALKLDDVLIGLDRIATLQKDVRDSVA